MYPVNDYLIVEEVKTEDSSPAGDGVVLYRPPADSAVRKYRIISGYYESGLKQGTDIYAKVTDVVEVVDGQSAVKLKDVIARDVK